MTVRLLALFVFLVSLAQTPPSAGSISGRVVDRDTGAPLAGINVGSQRIGRARTDAEGRYILRNVSPGTVTVFVQETGGGYLNMTLNRPRRVTVTSGRETARVDFRVRMDSRISGRVLDENGEPLPGINVSVVERSYHAGEQTYSAGGVVPRTLISAVTDDRGAYTISSVFAGRHYYLLAQPSTQYANPISDLPADPEARRRALVPTFYPSAASLASAVAIVPRSLEHRTDIDIRMQTAANYCISGILKAGATPARMRFAIQDESVPARAPGRNGVPPLGGESGGDGKFRVCGLYPGRFRLIAAQPASTSVLTPFSIATSVAISNSDVPGLNIVTIPPLTIAGEVVWDKAPANPSVHLTIGIRQNPRPPGLSRPSAQVTVPGEFSLIMLPTQDYSLTILPLRQPGAPSTGMPGTAYVKDITYGGSSVMYKAIRPGDSAARLRIVLGHDAGSIEVTAVRADGTPAVGSAVFVLPAATHTEAELAARLKEGYVDDTGSYRISNVPPERYCILATDDPPISQTNLPSMTLEISRTPETLSLLRRECSSGQWVDVSPRAVVRARVTPKTLDP